MLGKPAEERGEPLPCVSVGTRVCGAPPRPRGVLPGEAANRPGAIPSSFPVPGAAPASARAALRPGPGAWTGQRGTGGFCATSPEAQLRQLGGSQPLAACLRLRVFKLNDDTRTDTANYGKGFTERSCLHLCMPYDLRKTRPGEIRPDDAGLYMYVRRAIRAADPADSHVQARTAAKPQAEAPGQTWAGI